MEKLKSYTPGQVKNTAMDRRRQFGKVGGAMSTTGSMMALMFAGNLPAAQAMGEGLGRASDDAEFARNEVKRATDTMRALAGLEDMKKAGAELAMSMPSKGPGFFDQVTPASPLARVTNNIDAVPAPPAGPLTSVPNPKFAWSRGTFCGELRIQRDTRKL